MFCGVLAGDVIGMKVTNASTSEKKESRPAPAAAPTRFKRRNSDTVCNMTRSLLSKPFAKLIRLKPTQLKPLIAHPLTGR